MARRQHPTPTMEEVRPDLDLKTPPTTRQVYMDRLHLRPHPETHPRLVVHRHAQQGPHPTNTRTQRPDIPLGPPRGRPHSETRHERVERSGTVHQNRSEAPQMASTRRQPAEQHGGPYGEYRFLDTAMGARREDDDDDTRLVEVGTRDTQNPHTGKDIAHRRTTTTGTQAGPERRRQETRPHPTATGRRQDPT